MWQNYCDKKNQNAAAYREITKFKHQKNAHFGEKSGPKKKSLSFIYEEINALRRQLQMKPENTATSCR
jgi:DNA-binding transcriptional regulator YiaG